MQNKFCIGKFSIFLGLLILLFQFETAKPQTPGVVSTRCSTYAAPTVPAPLRTFYVDAANGNDANNGTSSATAWRTLSKANNTAIAGDLILLRGVFTDQWISPANSGTSTNKITYRKESGQSAILEATANASIFGISLSGQSHIVIDGLELRNIQGNPSITVASNSNNVWLRNLNVHDGGGITFRYGANNNRLEDSILNNIGSDQSNSGDAISLLNDTDSNVIVRNYVGNAGHSAYNDDIQGGTTGLDENNIVAQNVFENKWASNVILAGRSVGTLMECNIMRNATQTSAYNYGRMGIQLDGKSNIIRYNLLYNNKADGILIEGRVYAGQQQMFAESNSIYQNTFVGNGRSGIYMDIRDLGNTTGTNAYIRNNVIENNIFWSDVGNSPSNGTNGEIVVSFYYANSQWASGFTDGNIFRYNNFSNIPVYNFVGMLGSGNFTKLTPADLQTTYSAWTNNRQQDPLFTNATSNDYSLTSSSPMIDVGRLISGVSYNGTAPDLGAIESGGGSTQTPYPGPSAPNLPATIEAENFDNGGEGVAYHDLDSTNNGGAYRTTAVDVEARAAAGNGYDVFNASAGEWLEYSVNNPTAGYFNLGVTYASQFNNGKFHVEIDGIDVTGQMTANSTGSWSTFQTLTKNAVYISAGAHVVKLALDTNSPDSCACVVANFDKLTFTSAPQDQSIKINTDYNNQYGQVTLPNSAPFTSLGGFQIIWRIRGAGIPTGASLSGYIYTTGINGVLANDSSSSRLDGWYSLRSGDTGDGNMYNTPSDYTDIICKVQYDPANSRWTFESWKADGTGYVSSTKTIADVSNFNLGGTTLTIGGNSYGQRLAKGKLNYWRWIQRVESLGVFPSNSAPTGVTYLADYEFNGNVNDSSGRGLNLTWFGNSPAYE